MFRDQEEALARLEEELLEEATPEEEEDAGEEEEYEDFAEDVPVYNADHTDLDLDAFSEEVYAPAARKTNRTLAFIFLLLCGIFCVLAWWILRYKGVIG